MNTIKLLIDPPNVCLDIKQNPRWIQAFILISVLGILAGALTLPFSMQLAAAKMGVIPAGQTERVKDMSQMFGYVGLVFVPIALLIKWAVMGFFLYLLGFLFRSEMKFKPIFSLLAHANIILIVSSLVNILILFIKGPESVQHPLDLNVIGLHILFDFESMNHSLYYFFSLINVFEIWYLVVLFMGLELIFELDRAKSAAIIGVYWLISTSAMTGFASFSEKFQQF